MCLLILAHGVAPLFPLVVAANRDEFHARATAPAAFWTDHPDLYAGRDLEQGGTWMGVTRSGRFAAVTNFRDPGRTAPAPRSRGELPLDFLAGRDTPAGYLAAVATRGDEYAGFNLLVGDRDGLWYLDNSPGGRPEALAPGIYGLSNARLDTPWPKVELGKSRLRSLLEGDRLTHDALGAVVADRGLADEDALRLAGLEDGMARTLSAQFIVGEHYGTRSTTTLWIGEDGCAHWREACFEPAGTRSRVAEEILQPGRESGD